MRRAEDIGPNKAVEIDLSVVVPLLNEEESVGLLCDELQVAIEGLGISCEVILVDDGSSDSTPALLKEICKRDRRIMVLLGPMDGDHLPRTRPDFGRDQAPRCLQCR